MSNNIKISYYTDACPAVRSFLTYMGSVKNCSPKTVNEYYTDLRTFFRFMKIFKGKVPDDCEFESIDISGIDIDFISSITLQDILEYMNYLKMSRSNTASTRSRKVSSLRTFFNYLCNKTGQIALNPTTELETPKKKKSLPKHLSLEQSVSLLESVDGKFAERDFCILTLFLNCGLRLSELVGIDIGRINFDEKSMVILGKGNKERVVFLNNNCIDAIKNYLAVRPAQAASPADSRALFLSRLNKRISPKTVQWIVNRQLAEAGLTDMGFSTHKLRHTAATLMYQYGHVDIRILKDILGHENLGTTEIYTHLSTEQLKNAASSTPLSSVKIKHKETK